MNIEIRNIQHTKLNLEAFNKVVLKYAKSLKLKNDIVITFDKRLTKIDGIHHYDYDSKQHVIKLSPHYPYLSVDIEAEKYTTLSSLLHELKHASQIEKHGSRHHASKSFSFAKTIKDKEISEYYSVCESEARAYENKHLNKAVDFYISSC